MTIDHFILNWFPSKNSKFTSIHEDKWDMTNGKNSFGDMIVIISNWHTINGRSSLGGMTVIISNWNTINGSFNRWCD